MSLVDEALTSLRCMIGLALLCPQDIGIYGLADAAREFPAVVKPGCTPSAEEAAGAPPPQQHRALWRSLTAVTLEGHLE